MLEFINTGLLLGVVGFLLHIERRMATVETQIKDHIEHCDHYDHKRGEPHAP